MLSLFLNKIFQLGQSDERTPQQNSRTLFINKYSFYIALVTIPYFFIFTFSGVPTLGVLTLPVVSGYFFVIFFNAIRKYNFARFLMIFTGNVAVTSFSAACGAGAGIHLYFFPLMVFPFVCFEFEEKKSLVAGVFTPLILLLFVEIFEFHQKPWVVISTSAQTYIYLSMIVSSAISTLLVTYLAFQSAGKAKLELEKTIDLLNEEIEIRKKTELENSNTRKHLDTIFSHANDIIFVVDRDNRYLTINRGSGNIPDPSKIIGKTIYELMPKESAEHYASINKSVFKSKITTQFIDSYPNEVNGLIWHALTLVPVLNNESEVVQLVGFSRDITAEKELLDEVTKAKEQAEADSISKSLYLANLSHEIRNPLGIILGYIYLLKNESMSEEKKESIIDTINRNGKHLLKLVEDILDFSKIESGKFKLNISEVDIVSEINSVLDFFGSAVEKKNLKLHFINNADSVKCIFTDPDRFHQILVNLVSNAIKFCDEGRIEVSTYIVDEQNDKFFCIDIKDSGIGITDENKKKLFKPFMQAESGHLRKYGGSGLGLSISHEIANLLGAELKLKESRVNEGSTFSIKFNLKKFNTDLKSNLIESDESTTIKSDLIFSGKKILVVEDYPEMLDLISEFLLSAGADVTKAENGLQALDKVNHKVFDLILMDLTMPELDGYATAERLRRDGYTNPLIALSANVMHDSREKCLNIGFSDFISKPISKDKFFNTLANWIN